jgi:hypothetical protein
MPHSPSARIRAAAIALTALSTVAVASTPLTAQEGFGGLVVRVYDMANFDRESRAKAIGIAGGILAEAGVDAEWLDCRRSPGTQTTPCDAYRQPTDLIVRIMRGAGELQHPRPVLGVSIVDTAARTGTLATIFIDRLEPVARRTGADVASLVARTIAHEVGHLLLRTSQHGASGLMRETWTDWELARNRPEDWQFAAPERRQLRELRLRVSRTAWK